MMNKMIVTQLIGLCLACPFTIRSLTAQSTPESNSAAATQPPNANGQSPTKPKDLTEGLQDLLNEPAKEKTATPKEGKQGNARPAGADATKSNPLLDVEQGMSALAGLIRTKSDANRTQNLQREVVTRLDELIGQLEQQSQSKSQSSSQSSPPSDSNAPSESNPSAQSEPGDAKVQNAPPKSSSPTGQQSPSGEQPTNGDANNSAGDSDKSKGTPGDGPSGSPGQPGVSAQGPRKVTVDLSDPRALQRSAWGSLPERTREQMQSRMVERFLPGYRDEIEAYYLALVK